MRLRRRSRRPSPPPRRRLLTRPRRAGRKRTEGGESRMSSSSCTVSATSEYGNRWSGTRSRSRGRSSSRSSSATSTWYASSPRSPQGTHPYSRIEREMQNIAHDHGSARLSVICHSFGTDIVTSILKDHPKTLRIWRMILCGSVVRQDFRWDSIAHQIGEPDKPTRDFIVNDCGSGDQWPLLARAVTWGFGAAGTDGFGSTLVQDRFHDGGHSLFMTREFVRQYWKPFLSEGRYVSTKGVAPRSRIPHWLQRLGMLPLRWVLAALILTGAASLLSLGWWAARPAIGILDAQGRFSGLVDQLSRHPSRVFQNAFIQSHRLTLPLKSCLVKGDSATPIRSPKPRQA